MNVLLIWVGFSNRPIKSQPDLTSSWCWVVVNMWTFISNVYKGNLNACVLGHHFCRKHALFSTSSTIQVCWDINPIHKWFKIGPQNFTQRIPHPPALHPGFCIWWDLPWPSSCLLSSLVAKINLPPRWANYRLDSPSFPRGHGRVASKQVLSPSTTLCNRKRERNGTTVTDFLYSPTHPLLNSPSFPYFCVS